MKAVKGNKEYTISEVQLEQYVKDGFDVYEGGALVRQGMGKTVPAQQYLEAQEENNALQGQVAEAQAENEDLRRRLAELQKAEKPPRGKS